LLDDSSPGRYLPARGRAFTRTWTTLNCGALRGCCKELRARRQGCLEWRVGGRHVACSEDRRAAGMRATGLIAHTEERSVAGGTHRKFERGARSSSERRAGPVRCRARWREDQWTRRGERKRGRLRRAWEGKRRTRGSRWTETCVPRAVRSM